MDKGDAIKLEGNQEEIVQESDVSLNKRKIGGSDINPGGASSLTADTPKRGESEQGSSAGNENLLAGCIAVVNKLLCDTPSVDLSRERTALSGKFPGTNVLANLDWSIVICFFILFLTWTSFLTETASPVASNVFVAVFPRFNELSEVARRYPCIFFTGYLALSTFNVLS